MRSTCSNNRVTLGCHRPLDGAVAQRHIGSPVPRRHRRTNCVARRARSGRAPRHGARLPAERRHDEHGVSDILSGSSDPRARRVRQRADRAPGVGREPLTGAHRAGPHLVGGSAGVRAAATSCQRSSVPPPPASSPRWSRTSRGGPRPRGSALDERVGEAVPRGRHRVLVEHLVRDRGGHPGEVAGLLELVEAIRRASRSGAGRRRRGRCGSSRRTRTCRRCASRPASSAVSVSPTFTITGHTTVTPPRRRDPPPRSPSRTEGRTTSWR